MCVCSSILFRYILRRIVTGGCQNIFFQAKSRLAKTIIDKLGHRAQQLASHVLCDAGGGGDDGTYSYKSIVRDTLI